MDQRQQYESLHRPVRPRVPQPFTEATLRRQRDLLIHGGTWEMQEALPARPWSAASERLCASIREEQELEDWRRERERRTARSTPNQP